MADNVKPTFAKSEVKSGVQNETYMEKVLDGPYPKKDVDAIDKENQVHKAPNVSSGTQ